MTRFHSHSVEETRDWLQELLQRDGPFFDSDGVLRGAINARTLAPFTAEWGRTQQQPKPPEPLAIDYVRGTTYEDTWDAIGNYLEYLRARYDVTREPALRDEMRRMTQLAIDVYREDNPDSLSEWESRTGFFRRLYAGRHGQWPYPETLGTDQLAPLMWGLREVRELLDDSMRRELDSVAVGALDWFMRRNFAYIYRGTVIHHLDWGEHGLSYYIPALVWAHESTGQEKYLHAYQRLHTDYVYNPNHNLRIDPQNSFVWTQHAFKWNMWIPWLCQHAPNANYYQSLFPQFVTWYTKLLKNTLPTGLGHDYDNGHSVYNPAPYPPEWVDQPLVPDPNAKTLDGYDMQLYCDRARRTPLRQVRSLSGFARTKPDAVDVTPIAQILALCNTPDHFTYWFDPQDKIVPTIFNHRSWSLQAQFVCCWLTAYWRLRKLGVCQ